MSDAERHIPDWDSLFEIAVGQDGLFTTQQAREAGYSSQLLDHHIRKNRIARIQRGIYRLVHFPASEHEHLVTAWLWTNRKGVISHQTALALHELSDVLPSKIHVTLPSNWRIRRFRIPQDLLLHYDDVPEDKYSWFGSVPITGPERTLNDCARLGIAPDQLQKATKQALNRGLVCVTDLKEVEAVLEPFGGINNNAP